MDRRSFLSTLVGGIAVGAAQRTFPFRVYSFARTVVTTDDYFPKNIIIPINNALIIATGEQLDYIARIHGVERRIQGTEINLSVETDAALRKRICQSRTAFATPSERWSL